VETFDALSAGPLVVGQAQQLGLLTVQVDVDRLDEMGLQIRHQQDEYSLNGSPYLGGGVFSSDLLHLPTFLFSPPVMAFAADWRSVADNRGLWLTTAGGDVQLAEYLTSGDGFLGIVSSVGLTQIGLTSNYQALGMDNVRFSVPEPASGFAAAAGVALGLVRSMRRMGRRGVLSWRTSRIKLVAERRP
jgi:hypothetical protein